LLYELRYRWRDGTTHVAFEPLEFLEKLAALVPRPRFNLVRYHGILAPAARHRAEVVPGGDAPAQEGNGGASGPDDPAQAGEKLNGGEATTRPRERNYSWAELMRRVFEIDVLECPECGAAMRVLAAIHPPEATRAILECLGLPARAPPVAPPSPEPGDGTEAWA